MVDRFTKEEANVLTTKGFQSYCNALRNSMTHERAYEATELIHQKVDDDGERKYADYLFYCRVLTRANRKRRASTATV